MTNEATPRKSAKQIAAEDAAVQAERRATEPGAEGNESKEAQLAQAETAAQAAGVPVSGGAPAPSAKVQADAQAQAREETEANYETARKAVHGPDYEAEDAARAEARARVAAAEAAGTEDADVPAERLQDGDPERDGAVYEYDGEVWDAGRPYDERP